MIVALAETVAAVAKRARRAYVNCIFGSVGGWGWDGKVDVKVECG